MTKNHDWPSGAVTFLFSDIEDSTPLWDRHRAAMRPALAEHDALLQTAVTSNGGVIVKTTGDGVMAAFTSPSAALAAALDAQRALRDTQWPTITPDKIQVRMGLHTGEAELRAGDYYGTAVNRAARIMSIGHGGQVLLSGTAADLIGGGLPSAVRLLDLGEHKLKGLNRPARIFQVNTESLPHDFPPLQTGETRKGNLPEPLTSFIGREKELANIEHLLQETRLLTLSGPGGTGKTRLSLETGHHLQGVYDHGVWLAELASLSDEALVPTAVASIFDLREQPSIPIMDTLVDYLRGKKTLLILDNCEHLVSACARLAADLLPAAPRLTILASSREGLGVPGETTMHIPAMGIPTRDMVDRDELAQFEAVRLFVARTRAAKPGFELNEDNSEAVGQIVRRLDGIPLAIELAAARVKLLSPAQIAARLDDRFRLLTGGSRTALPRQQTLRALIDWSYDLLDEDERWFFRQMAVFAGGWTLEAAEYVVESANLETGFLPKDTAAGNLSQKNRFLDAFDLLADLVNKSLVRIDDSGDEMRYYYLETIRQYASDRLYEAGEISEARTRHFNYFLQMTNDGFDGTMESYSDLARLAYLERDLDNLRTALDWGAANDPVVAIYLLHYPAALWSMLGLGRELRYRAELLLEAVAHLPPAGETSIAARRQARAFGLSIFAQGGGLTGGDEKAYLAAEEAATLFRDDGSLSAPLANTLFWQSVLGVEIGQPEGYAAAQECYEISREINNRVLQQLGLIALARWELIKGDTSAAAGHLAEASRLHTTIGIPVLIAYQAYAESMVSRSNGDFDNAHRVLAKGVEALQQSHHRLFANVLDSERGHTMRQSGDLAGAVAIYRRTIAEWQDLGNRAAVANQLECFAFLAVAENLNERAAQLFGAAEILRETLSNMMTPSEKEDYDAHVTALREAMDEDALAEAWQAGRGLDLDTAVTYALAGEKAMMVEPDRLLQRLEAIAQSVAGTSRGLALIGLGSVGAELDRLDGYSDLDFFVIVQPGAKSYFLESLFWLENVAPVVYSFLNTPDGYKLLFADGIFAELAVFEPDELAHIPFSGGRFVWRAPGFELPVPLSGNALPQAETSPSTEWLVNEALTNLYIGLGRYQRGEKLSVARSIQGHAVDRLLALAPHIEESQAEQSDPFDPARRFERSFPETAAHLPQFIRGYENSPAAARAILTFLDSHFEINPALKTAILDRCLQQYE